MSASGMFATWEAAVAWLIAQPDRQELVRACYYDRPALAAAERYWSDPEWQALRAILPATRGMALDIGAGMGIASYALARDGWATTALEPDPSALVGAGAIRALAEQARLRIEVVEQWGERLPFAESAFDLVHARQVLHHARDLDAFCRELFRVLKPGGMLVATREHVISSPAQLPAFLERHDLHALYGGENAFMLRRYLAALRGAGFEVARKFGPLESVINYAPFSEESLCAEIGRRASGLPGGKAAAAALLAPPWRRLALSLLSRVDRRPGRLFTFVCRRD
ncbi:MAG: class I SAM-dependent methyltransferase [Burkholderiales bacterium]